LAPAPSPIALITGASAGIGAAFARLLAERGHECALAARRAERLTTVANAIAAAGHKRPHVIPLDLAERDGPARLAGELTARGLEPAIVVNNAGFGLRGPAADLDRAEQLAMIDLNVRLLTDLSLAFIEPLQRRRGGILNVASLAGFLPGPGMAVYYASKAYVLSFSEALHRELKPRGVRVTVVCPGPVPTEFQARAGIDRRVPLLTCSPEQVARAGYRGLVAGRRVVVPGLGNRLLIAAIRFVPRTILLAATENVQRRSRRPPS
jgi:uncharacterized protein